MGSVAYRAGMLLLTAKTHWVQYKAHLHIGMDTDLVISSSSVPKSAIRGSGKRDIKGFTVTERHHIRHNQHCLTPLITPPAKRLCTRYLLCIRAGSWRCAESFP